MHAASDSQYKLLSNSSHLLLWVTVFVVLCLCTAFTDFTTKGEPREAIVSMTMLSSGNWILPVDASGDISFKPPMFHWLATLFSLPVGHVTEFTSRLPSVLALTILLIITSGFCSRRFKGSTDQNTGLNSRRYGLLCATLALTCFEMMRAGTIARVDMVLTTFMAGAMIALFYSKTLRHTLAYMAVAILCMSGGVLTKGPVAVILPLGAYWIWRIFNRDNFFKITGLCLLLALLSLIIPFLWYFAAYRQGGDIFLTLALEENFGRFMGKMTYESHEHNAIYNVYSVLIGLLPWSAAILLTFVSNKVRKALKYNIRHLKIVWKEMSPEARFATIAALTVFIFYCIPKSKRSVYLLPMYPFMAYGLGWYAVWLVKQKIITVKLLKTVIVAVIALYTAAIGIVMPILSRHNSDRLKAEEIEKIIPASKPIYTFIPERFARYYILDFYLGGRLSALIPSGQVVDTQRRVSDIKIPNDSSFYLLTGENIIKENSELWDAWLNEHDLSISTEYKSDKRCHDLKDTPIIFKVSKFKN